MRQTVLDIIESNAKRVEVLPSGWTIFVTGELRNDIGMVSNNVSAVKHALEQLQLDLITPGFIAAVSRDQSEIFMTVDYLNHFQLYFQCGAKGCDFSNDISSFQYEDLDPVSIYQTVAIYGNRPSAGHTLYKRVERIDGLYVYRFRALDRKNYQLVERDQITRSSPSSLSQSEPELLESYADLLFRAIEVENDSRAIVILLSSGWDSTSILSILVNQGQRSRIKCLIGRMFYSDRSGCANDFEIEKAKKITDYFSVELVIVDLNYASEVSVAQREFFEELEGFDVYNLTALNHFALVRYACKTFGGDIHLFAGEISDGMHNLGFSQFVSLFHPLSKGFREYADKARCYLYGPSFYNSMINGAADDDPVFRFLDFDITNERLTKSSADFLYSFFGSDRRLPVYDTGPGYLTEALGALHKARVCADIDILANRLGTRSHHSIFIQKYRQFHWQGSTVASLGIIAKYFGVSVRLPFGDPRLLEFMGTTPEEFGRGLEVKPTKYPLKDLLATKVDYPLEMQKGPHAYRYDVEPKFVHSEEILFHSKLQIKIKDSLKKIDPEQYFDPNYFNLDQVSSIIKNFGSGIKRPGDYGFLLSLFFLNESKRSK